MVFVYPDCRSPLWTATFNRHLYILNKVIEAGSNVNATNKVRSVDSHTHSGCDHRGLYCVGRTIFPEF